MRGSFLWCLYPCRVSGAVKQGFWLPPRISKIAAIHRNFRNFQLHWKLFNSQLPPKIKSRFFVKYMKWVFVAFRGEFPKKFILWEFCFSDFIYVYSCFSLAFYLCIYIHKYICICIYKYKKIGLSVYFAPFLSSQVDCF